MAPAWLDGQVPGGMYDDSALDTGGGLRPDLTSQGKGREAIQTGLDFGRQQFAPCDHPASIQPGISRPLSGSQLAACVRTPGAASACKISAAPRR